MKQTQTDNQIEEEHLLNFVVNTLDEELPIDLADGVKVSSEKLYEFLAVAIVVHRSFRCTLSWSDNDGTRERDRPSPQ